MSSRRKSCATCILAKTKCIRGDAQRCERCLRLNKQCGDVLEDEVLAARKRAKRTRDTTGTDVASHRSSQLSRTLQKRRAKNIESDGGADSPNEFLLDRYRNEMTRQFPFVVVPANISASELEEEKPMLHNVIMMVASDNPAQFTYRGKKFREDLARRVFVDGEKKLEILQAILVALGFYHVHVAVNLQLGNLFSLGLAMLSDLKLDVNTRRIDRRKTELATKEATVFYSAHREKTLEERRVYLGFFCFGTFIFIGLKKLDFVRATPYTRECCSMLETHAEFDSDQYLVRSCRILSLAQRIHSSLDREDAEPLSMPEPNDRTRFDMLKSELQTFNITTPVISDLRKLVLPHIQLVELYLYDIYLDSLLQANDFDIYQTRIMHDCVRLAQQLIESFLSSDIYPASVLTYIRFVHLDYPIVVLARLSEFADLKSDTSLDFEGTLQLIEDKMEEAAEHVLQCSEEKHNNPYRRLSKQVRTLKERYIIKKRVDASKSSTLQSATQIPAADLMATNGPDCMATFGVDQTTIGDFILPDLDFLDDIHFFPSEPM